MNRSNMLRDLAFTVALTVTGCFAQSSDDGSGDANDGDGARAQPVTVGTPSGSSTAGTANATAISRGGAVGTRPACDSCGPGVPWTERPGGDIGPASLAVEPEPSPPPR